MMDIDLVRGISLYVIGTQEESLTRDVRDVIVVSNEGKTVKPSDPWVFIQKGSGDYECTTGIETFRQYGQGWLDTILYSPNLGDAFIAPCERLLRHYAKIAFIQSSLGHHNVSVYRGRVIGSSCKSVSYELNRLEISESLRAE